MPKHKGSSPTEGGVAELLKPRKRDEQLAALIDHCVSAQHIADTQGERFLSYMLAMTIQAARGVALERAGR